MIQFIIFALIVAAVATFVYFKVTDKPLPSRGAVVSYVAGVASAAAAWASDIWDKVF